MVHFKSKRIRLRSRADNDRRRSKVLAAQFVPSPRRRRRADEPLELSPEVVDVAEPASLRYTRQGRIVVDHQGLRGDEALANEPAARAFA